MLSDNFPLMKKYSEGYICAAYILVNNDKFSIGLFTGFNIFFSAVEFGHA